MRRKLSCAILAVFALVMSLDETAGVAAQRSGTLSSHTDHPSFSGLPPMDAVANPHFLITQLPNEPFAPDETWQAVASGRNTICIFDVQALRWESSVTAYPSGFSGGISIAGAGMAGYQPMLFAGPSGPSTHPLLTLTLGQQLSQPEEIGTFPGAKEFGYRFTVGDLVGDPTPEFIAATGPGGPAGVHVFETGTNEMMTVYPFGPNYRDGFNLAVGDINGNRRKDLLIAQARGREFTALEFTDLRSDPQVLGFGDFFGPTFFGGANLAAFDFNRDGFHEVVFGAGNGTPLVRIVNFNGPTPSLVYQFTAGPASASEGVRVDVGLRNGVPVISTLTDLEAAGSRQELALWFYEQAGTPVFQPSFKDVPFADGDAFFKFIEDLAARR